MSRQVEHEPAGLEFPKPSVDADLPAARQPEVSASAPPGRGSSVTCWAAPPPAGWNQRRRRSGSSQAR
jgi:hypothetical protein